MPWVLESFLYNPNVTIDFIDTYLSEYFEDNCTGSLFKSLSNNPTLTIEFIKEYRDENWDWGAVSRNPKMTIDIICQNPDLPWDWIEISYHNLNISMEMIQ